MRPLYCNSVTLLVVSWICAVLQFCVYFVHSWAFCAILVVLLLSRVLPVLGPGSCVSDVFAPMLPTRSLPVYLLACQ